MTQFVGRQAELERLHQQLQPGNTVAISAVSGMGGIGKTELALEYARKHCREGAYSGGICWVSAREDVGTQIISFARSLLNLTPPDDLELAEKVRWCWGHWQEGAALVILDDVQDFAEVRLFLPPTESHFQVLMTTRSHFGSPVQELQLDVLSEAEALELLRALVQDERVDQQLAQAQQLCDWLGYLPLGVELVGRYLAKKRDLTIAELQQRLQKKRLDAIAFKQAEPGMTASLGVAAAFELSWQNLEEPAQQVAAVLSLFALVEIPWRLVEQCLPEVDTEELEEIRDRALLGANLLKRVDQGMYQLHQLLREFFAVKRSHRADDTELQRQFYEVVVAEVEKVIENPERSLIKESTIMIAHLQMAIELLASPEQVLDLATCLSWIASLYYEQGRYGEAEPLYMRSLSIREQKLGTDHPDVATSLNNLAKLYSTQGRYEAAEPLYLQAIEIRQRHLGQDHPDVAASLNNLAELYKQQGRYEAAESLHLQALGMWQRHLGQDHPDVAASLNNLAELYERQGRYEAAESLHLQAIEIRQRHLGQDHPGIALSLNNLAELYEQQGRYEEAESLHLQALGMWQRHLGQDHPDVAVSLNNLAKLYERQGRYEEAEPLHLQARWIWERCLGQDHQYVATGLVGLALLYERQGRYKEAEPLYLRALEIYQRTFGDDHPFVAASFNNLALLYRAQERYSEAESLFLQAVSIMQKQGSADHPYIARFLHNLAVVYDKQGRYREAESLYLQALPILSAKLEESHHWRQDATNNFQSLLQKTIHEYRTDELSNDPLTQDLLRQLQNLSE